MTATYDTSRGIVAEYEIGPCPKHPKIMLTTRHPQCEKCSKIERTRVWVDKTKTPTFAVLYAPSPSEMSFLEPQPRDEGDDTR